MLPTESRPFSCISPIAPNTTASGEGKWLYDQIGGTCCEFILHAVKTGRLKFTPGQSIAGTIVEFCNENFRTAKSDSITRYFYELKEQDIKVHSSPVKTLKICDNKGVSAYHAAIIKPGNILKFKPYSCVCEEAINSDFNINCKHTKHCGLWTVNIKTSKYPIYSQAKHTPKTKKNKKKKKGPQQPQPHKRKARKRPRENQPSANPKPTPGSNLQHKHKRQKVVMRIPKTRSVNQRNKNSNNIPALI